MRDEIPPFDAATGEPTRLPTMGFRLALSAPAAGSLPEVEQARGAFAGLSGERTRAADDPRTAVALLREGTADEALRGALDRLSARLTSDERARGFGRDRTGGPARSRGGAGAERVELQ